MEGIPLVRTLPLGQAEGTIGAAPRASGQGPADPATWARGRHIVTHATLAEKQSPVELGAAALRDRWPAVVSPGERPGGVPLSLAFDAQVALGAHLMIRVFLSGGYKPPREANGVVGVALWVLTLALGFTGYLLPWDQLAFWAVTVGANMVARTTTAVRAGGECSLRVG